MTRSLGDTAPGRIFRYLRDNEGKWIPNVVLVREVFGNFNTCVSTVVSNLRREALPPEFELITEIQEFEGKKRYGNKLTRRVAVEPNGQTLIV